MVLESLDLSSNKLSGRIPRELTSRHFLRVMWISLSKKCVVDKAPQPSKEEEVESDLGFDWKVILMGYGCGLVVGLFIGCLVFLTRKPKWFVRMIEGDRHKKVRRSTRSTCRHGARRS
ncbi:hypothetical protein AAG906_010088 [Vitis piasezkii]